MNEPSTQTPTRVIVITTPDHLTDDRREAIERYASGKTGQPVMVLPAGSTIDVLDLPALATSRAEDQEWGKRYLRLMAAWAKQVEELRTLRGATAPNAVTIE